MWGGAMEVRERWCVKVFGVWWDVGGGGSLGKLGRREAVPKGKPVRASGWDCWSV